ncbi:hypothetical protein NEIG_01081 [Nematocida sp. ERTm5]|nr:hypothetical protein NEIG_01081 [Nematocida sp. ERTm5]
MKWDVICTERKFFIDAVFSTKVSITAEDDEILMAACNFTGMYLKRNTSSIFLETEKVILGTNTARLDGVQYSLFLPKDIPPSYCGNNIGIVYNLNVYVQGMRTEYNKTFICSVVSSVPACFENSSKLFISEQYENVKEPNGSMISYEEKPEVVFGYEKIVDGLRRVQIAYKKKEEVEFIVENKNKSSYDSIAVSNDAKKYWIVEKENTHHPLDLYSKMLKYYSVGCTRQAFYSITTHGKEYAKVLIKITEEDSPNCVLSLRLDFIEPTKSVSVSLVQVEIIDEIESRECFFNKTKHVEYATKIFLTIPLDRARNPTIITPNFSTRVEMLVIIDGVQEIKIKIK